MEQKEQLYEGKAKKVFATDDPELLIVAYKDDATAFNGLKKGTIVGKGVINNKMSNRLMAMLEKNGIPTHYVKELSDRETLVKKVSIVPLEVIVRNISAGSFAKRYRVEAVCGVGMGATGSQLEDVRKTNALSDALPLFTLQGGFDITRLRGIYRLMMNVMSKTVGKTLAEKQDRTADEDAMLDLLVHGGSRVSEENLAAVMEWYRQAV